MAPTILNSTYAEAEIYDLTFLRCDYKFAYVIEIEGTKFVIGELVVPSKEAPTTPKQPHLVYPGIPSNMRVMYVSSAAFPSPQGDIS